MSVQKPTMRSSSLPMFMTCSNSVLNPDQLVRVETENEPAVLGTLVHNLAQTFVETGDHGLMELHGKLSGEDFSRASKLMDNFLTIWREASKYMTRPQAEIDFTVELSHAILTGHIDYLHLEALRAFILDLKTGRQHDDHYHQMAAYAFGAWDKAGRPSRFTVYVTVVYVEDMAVHPYEFTADSLREWEKSLAVQVLQPRYTAGRKCAVCSLQDSCPAYAAFGANSIRLFQTTPNMPAPQWESLPPEERGEIVDRMYQVEKAIDRAKLGLRNLVKRDGRVDIGGGKEMVLVEDTSLFLNGAAAYPILIKKLGAHKTKALIRLPLTEVLGAYAADAPKGKKITARNELFEELDKAGAIVRTSSTKMWRRPKDEKQLEVQQ